MNRVTEGGMRDVQVCIHAVPRGGLSQYIPSNVPHLAWPTTTSLSHLTPRCSSILPSYLIAATS